MSPNKNPIQVALAMALAAALVLAVFSPAQAQPPSNDTWEGATVIASLPYAFWQDTSEATTTSEEPVPSCWYGWFNITNTVWYAYTPPSPQHVRASSRGSYYESTLAVFTHSESGFTQIYCTRFGKVNFAAIPGETYYFYISSKEGSGGMMNLFVEEVPIPGNDDFTNAKVVQSTPFTESIEMISASVESGEPMPSCNYWSGGQKTVWYALTPATDGILHSYATSEYSAFSTVWSGNMLGDLIELGCEMGYGLHINLQAGVTYYIQLATPPYEDLNSIPVNISIDFSPIVPPANDDFENAQIIGSLPFTDNQEIYAATLQPSEQLASCISWGEPASIWYVYTPIQAGLLVGQIDTSFNNFWAVWTGDELGSLTEVACNAYGTTVTIGVPVQPGVTYYLQMGRMFGNVTGHLSVSLDIIPPPPNDDFANAQLVDGLPFTYGGNNRVASSQPGETGASCAWSGPQHTVWFGYTPTESRSVTVRLPDSFWYNFVAVYTGESLETLTEISCSSFLYHNPVTFHAQAGTIYYLQVGSLTDWDYGDYTIEVDYTPPPEASLAFSPFDPSIFDSISFWDISNDPANIGFSEFWWDFGDGSTAVGNPVTHLYTADGDYTVWHKVQTPDMRTAETTQVIQVRTHDVAITKFNPPESARAGQTKSITVGLRNTRYPETVVVELHKSTPFGFVYVGSLEKSVPVRPSNRTTDFIFNYTFTLEDALQGKVTFKAIAYIQGYRDPLSADNEAIALPTIVRR